MAALAACRTDFANSARDQRTVPLSRGVFLISTHRVAGYFAETVLLLLDHSATGAYGVIINRRSDMALARLFASEDAPAGRTDLIYQGGPVEMHQLTLLLRSGVRPKNSSLVVDDIYMSSGTGALRRAMQDGAPENRLRAYFGHAGWAPGQLEGEVQRGDWHVVAATTEMIFAPQPEKIWPQLIFEHDGIQVRIRVRTDGLSPS